MPYNNLEFKNCDNCGLRFQPTSGRQVYCTDCGITNAKHLSKKSFVDFGERLATAMSVSPVCIRCGSMSLQSYEDGEQICVACGKLQSRPD